MSIRIVIADDHPVVRKGLAQFFHEEEGLVVVAECDDGVQAVTAVRRFRPDVLIVDLRMPVMTGMEVIREIARDEFRPAVIVLAGNITDDEVIEAMRLGVKGVVLKEMAAKLLVQSVRKVASGGVWLEKESVARALDRLLEFEQTETSPLLSRLTDREVEIVRMAATGLSNRDIGEKLFISEGTVKSHLHTIYDKLGVAGRVQLANFARAQRLLPPERPR